MPDNKSQLISYDNQNFDIDIDKVYSDFMKEIDNIRSYTNFNKDVAEKYIKSLDTTKNNSNNIEIGVEKSYQESRCHAFYRLIGLPVLGSDGRFYSPGHDNIKEERSLYLDEKRAIALDPIPGFDKLILARENYLNSLVKVFSKPTSIDAGALCVSSGGCGDTGLPNLREFNVPFAKNEDGMDMSIDSQSYTIDLNTLVGENIINLTDFQSPDGEGPYQLTQTKKHIIKPFIVSGKIDFTVRPATRRICVPFVYDKTNTMIASNVYGKRPLIEKLIRDRIQLINSGSDIGPSNESLNDYIKNISSIKDESLIDKINNSSIYKLSEKREFVKYLFIIQAMMKRLVQATDFIKRAQSQYYWVPQPSINGPEEGSRVRDVFVPTNMSNENLMTELDKSILLSSIKNSINNLIATKSPTNNDSPDDFAFSEFTNTFDGSTTESLGNSAGNQLEELVTQRKTVLSQANSALRTVEIIMGEFSGLGLCDIMAIMGSLHIMPLENLLGLIDFDAFNRMEKILETNGSIQQKTVSESLELLSSLVKDFYTIMDKIYLDELMNNGIAPD